MLKRYSYSYTCPRDHRLDRPWAPWAFESSANQSPRLSKPARTLRPCPKLVPTNSRRWHLIKQLKQLVFRATNRFSCLFYDQRYPLRLYEQALPWVFAKALFCGFPRAIIHVSVKLGARQLRQFDAAALTAFATTLTSVTPVQTPLQSVRYTHPGTRQHPDRTLRTRSSSIASTNTNLRKRHTGRDNEVPPNGRPGCKVVGLPSLVGGLEHGCV